MPDNDKIIGLANFGDHFFKGHQVRMTYEDGISWAVLTDVCEAMEMVSPSQIASRLEPDEKRIHEVRTSTGTKNVIVVNEPGIWRIIMRSNKRIAREFQRWLAHSVLPEIRRNGTYSLQNETAQSQDRIDGAAIDAVGANAIGTSTPKSSDATYEALMTLNNTTVLVLLQLQTIAALLEGRPTGPRVGMRRV